MILDILEGNVTEVPSPDILIETAKILKNISNDRILEVVKTFRDHPDDLENVKRFFRLMDEIERQLRLRKYDRLPQGENLNAFLHTIPRLPKGRKRQDGSFELIDTNKSKKTEKSMIMRNQKPEDMGQLLGAVLAKRIRPSAIKLTYYLLKKVFEEGKTLITFELPEYMEVRGLKDRRHARKQLLEDMETLSGISFEFSSPRGKCHFSIYGGFRSISKRGTVQYRITPEFLQVIPQKQFLFLPKEFFMIDDRQNPHAYSLISKLSLHKHLNHGRKNENVISIRSLLESCHALPTHEEVAGSETDRHVYERIIQPFERDMDSIRSFSWEYTDPVSGKKKSRPTDYDSFISLNVTIYWKDHPRELPPTFDLE